jgi:hypothetical protein
MVRGCARRPASELSYGRHYPLQLVHSIHDHANDGGSMNLLQDVDRRAQFQMMQKLQNIKNTWLLKTEEHPAPPPENHFNIFRHEGNLLHLYCMLHNFCHMSHNTTYFIILSFEF